MVQEVGLSPSAMIMFAPHWHAVILLPLLLAGTIGYLYLNSILMSP